MLLLFSATVCTVVIGTLSAKPKYEATSQILLKVGREKIYMPEMLINGNSSAAVRYDLEKQINSEIAILTSPSLTENVVESLGPTKIYEGLDVNDEQDSITKLAVLRVQKALRVKGIENSNVIEVSFKHTNPKIATKVVNALVNLFLEGHLDVHKRPQSNKFFQDQSRVLRKILGQTEGESQTFKILHNTIVLNEQRSCLLRQIAALCTELDQALSQEAETTRRIEQLGQQLASTPKTIPQEDDILIVRDKLAMEERKRYGSSSYGPNVPYQRLQEDLFRYQGDLKTLKSKRDVLAVQLDDYQGKLEELNRIEVELNGLQDEIEVDQQDFRLNLSQLEESRISDAMDAEKIANVLQIQPARLPLKPVSPKVELNILLAFFGGGLGALGLGFFLEYLDDRLEKPDDAEHLLRLPVLASIPEYTSCSPGSAHGRVLFRTSFSPWFALATIVLVAVCLTLNVGHSLKDSQLETEGAESLMDRNVVRAKIVRRTNNVKNPVTESSPLTFAHDKRGAKVASASIPDQDHVRKKENDQEISGGQNHGPGKASINKSELQSREAIKKLFPSPEEGREVLNSISTPPELSPEKAERSGLTIQVGAFRERSRAEDLVRMLQDKGYDSYVSMQTSESLKYLYLVRIGGIESGEEARAGIAHLVKLGFNDCYVMRLALNQ